MPMWGFDRKTMRIRKPCPEDPVLLRGQPIGTYHCPICGEHQIAGLPHMDPEPDYEVVYGHLWPPGYVDNPTPEALLEARVEDHYMRNSGNRGDLPEEGA